MKLRVYFLIANMDCLYFIFYVYLRCLDISQVSCVCSTQYSYIINVALNILQLYETCLVYPSRLFLSIPFLLRCVFHLSLCLTHDWDTLALAGDVDCHLVQVDRRHQGVQDAGVKHVWREKKKH